MANIFHPVYTLGNKKTHFEIDFSSIVGVSSTNRNQFPFSTCEMLGAKYSIVKRIKKQEDENAV